MIASRARSAGSETGMDFEAQVSCGISVVDVHLRTKADLAVGLLADIVEAGRRQVPAEEPLGFLGAHVDAAMAHGGPEIVVPVGSMEGVALVGEEAVPGDTWQDIIVKTGGQVGISHVLGGHLDLDVVVPGGGGGR